MEHSQIERASDTPKGAAFPLQRHYIDGEYRDSVEGGTFSALDPCTNQFLVDVADGGAADIDPAVPAAAPSTRVPGRTCRPPSAPASCAASPTASASAPASSSSARSATSA